MHYQHEWVKVRESVQMCAAIEETVAFTNLAGIDITKQKEGKTYVSKHHIAYPQKVTIINYSHGK